MKELKPIAPVLVVLMIQRNFCRRTKRDVGKQKKVATVKETQLQIRNRSTNGGGTPRNNKESTKKQPATSVQHIRMLSHNRILLALKKLVVYTSICVISDIALLITAVLVGHWASRTASNMLLQLSILIDLFVHLRDCFC